MAENNFNVDYLRGNPGERFVADHFVEITGIDVPPEAVRVEFRTVDGENTGSDGVLSWQIITSGEQGIIDHGRLRRVNSPMITGGYQGVVEAKTDCGLFLSRNSIEQPNKIVCNSPCGSLGFEVYKQGTHNPGWLFQYMEGLKFDGSGGRCAEPTYIVYPLFLRKDGTGIPFACVSIPWTTETVNWIKWYISRYRQWRVTEYTNGATNRWYIGDDNMITTFVLEDTPPEFRYILYGDDFLTPKQLKDIENGKGAGAVYPPCGATHGDGLAWQGIKRGEYNMIHILMTDILKHMSGRIVMVGKPLTDVELFTTAGFNDCAKWYCHGDYLEAEKIVKQRYRFLQDHATGQIIL